MLQLKTLSVIYNLYMQKNNRNQSMSSIGKKLIIKNKAKNNKSMIYQKKIKNMNTKQIKFQK